MRRKSKELFFAGVVKDWSLEKGTRRSKTPGGSGKLKYDFDCNRYPGHFSRRAEKSYVDGTHKAPTLFESVD